MAIIVNPTSLDLAAGVEGMLELGGSIFTPGQPQGFYPDEYVVGANLYLFGGDPSGGVIFKEISGYSAGAESQAVGTYIIPKQMPFYIQGGGVGHLGVQNRDHEVGVIDNLGRITTANPYSQLTVSPSKFRVKLNGNIVGSPVNYNLDNLWAVQSNGTTISVMWRNNGIWYQQASMPIPSDVEYYKFFLMSKWGDYTQMMNIITRIDDVTLPFTTLNTTIAIDPPALAEWRAASISQFGITGNTGGDGVAILTHPQVAEPVNVPITISPLYLRPTDRSCGNIAVQSETIQFESNGGQGGVFEASNGTIIGTMQWQAPADDSAAGWSTFLYTVGDISANCTLNVVKRLVVSGVDTDGFYPDLAQGESVQFTSTCPGAVFSSPSHPTLISSTGFLTAPVDGSDCCFGEKMVVVEVTGCGQVYTFRVKIQAMYPVPRFCGAYPKKWKQNVPDYLANTLTFTGGTSQVKNRNKFGIHTWEVEYENLLNSGAVDCTCPVRQSDEHSSDCAIVLTTARRLDDFYNQVKYTSFFTVVDYHTGIRYKYTRLTRFDNDHNLFRTEQIRRVNLRWEGNINIASGEPACVLPEGDAPCPPANVYQLNWEVIEW